MGNGKVKLKLFNFVIFGLEIVTFKAIFWVFLLHLFFPYHRVNFPGMNFKFRPNFPK